MRAGNTYVPGTGTTDWLSDQDVPTDSDQVVTGTCVVYGTGTLVEIWLTRQIAVSRDEVIPTVWYEVVVIVSS